MRKISALSFLFSISLLSCHKDAKIVDIHDYPAKVGNILVGKCATSGCHNNASYMAAGGLNLNTWEDLFKGTSAGGSAVIPYRSDFSSLCYFTNTDPDLGVSLEPSMPINNAPLTQEEYLALRDWIVSGAPNADGKIKFADNPSRKKTYVVNKACDVVTVFDSETFLQMRYINVGNSAANEIPECIKVSPDKKNWYVSFFAQSNIVQKFNAENDQLVGEINLGTGSRNTFAITGDSKYGFFSDNIFSGGKIAYVDLQSMSVITNYTFGFKYMMGMALNENLNKIYIGSATGNFIYKIDITNRLSPIITELPIDGTSTVQYSSLLDPIDLIINPITNKCYVACQKTNEIRVIDMQTDALINTIPLGSAPAFMSYSQFAQKLIVTCPDDSVTFIGNRGSVVLIDALSNTIQKKINSGYQPFGLSVDDQGLFVAVANANISSSGPAPHHTSVCGGRNGNVTFIDLKTLELIPNKRSEVAVFPFGVSTR